MRTFQKILFCLCIFLPLHTGSAAESHGVADSGNWNIRIDGAVGGDWLGYNALHVADLNNNGKNDLLLGSWFAGNNGALSGSAWVIYDDILESYTGTGNTIDMADSNNWNIRFDGAAAADFFSVAGLTTGDVDGDNKPDILVSSYNAGNNSRAGSGSLYVIYNTLLDDYTGTGNIVDMGDTGNYNLRVDGAVAGDNLTLFDSIKVVDIDGEGNNDLLVGTRAANNNYPHAGSLYIIYHSLLSAYVGTGNTIDLADPNTWNIRYDGGDDNLAGDELLSHNLDFTNPVDIDGDNKLDLILGAYARNNAIAPNHDDGSIYIISNTLVDDYAGTGNIVGLDDTNNFSIRLDSSHLNESSHGAFGSIIVTGDFDADGKPDIATSAFDADNQLTSSNGKGWVFVFLNTFLDYYSGTGNIITVAPDSNYNLRFTGSDQKQFLGADLNVGDWNNDGVDDLFIGGSFPEEVLSQDQSIGVLYVVYSDILSASPGVGNNLLITDPGAYSFRYEGFAGSAFAQGSTGIFPADINNDGSLDVMTSARVTGFNSRGSSGSVYIIFNFPHNIATASDAATTDQDTASLSGTVDASDSATHISGVEFQINGNDPLGIWNPCTATDGTFDSTLEDFSCELTDLSNGSFTVYFRAMDQNSAYTSVSHYASVDLTVAIPDVIDSGGGSGGGSNGGSSRAIVQKMKEQNEISSTADDFDATPDLSPENNTQPFRDTPDSAWFFEFVSALQKTGIIQGYGQNKDWFLPNQSITRAEFVKMLVAIFLQNLEESSVPFLDLENHWAKNFIAWALTKSWVQGYTDGLFHPDQSVTRAEAAKIVVQAFGLLQKEDSKPQSFPDVPPADWFFPPITTLASYGIVNGYTDGLFHPNDTITRAEATKLIVKAAAIGGFDLIGLAAK